MPSNNLGILFLFDKAILRLLKNQSVNNKVNANTNETKNKRPHYRLKEIP